VLREGATRMNRGPGRFITGEGSQSETRPRPP
jgi:hypothetical protein